MSILTSKLFKKAAILGILFANLVAIDKKTSKDSPMNLFGVSVVSADIDLCTLPTNWCGGNSCCGSGCSGCCAGASASS